MRNKIILFTLLLAAPCSFVLAGETALSQLPASQELGATVPPPAAPSSKAAGTWVDFTVRQSGRSGFYLNDLSQGIQVNGYKDFDGNMRFSGLAGDESLFGEFGRSYNSQELTFEMGQVRLQVKRCAIHYKVTGTAPGPNGALLPVNLLIKGAVRGRDYAISEAGLDLRAYEDRISGSVEPASHDKKLVAALAAILASLQTDEVFCVVEKGFNYPNPFLQGNGTTLSYTLMQPADQVRITVFNAYGKVITELDGGTGKGGNTAFWDGRDPHNTPGVGGKVFIWQMEIFLRGEKEKILKHFRLDGR